MCQLTRIIIIQTITFVSKCSNYNILEGAVRSKALCARRSWVIMMCSVGETFYSPSISPRSWNNWLSILEYSRVSCDLFSQSKLEAFWPIAFERCREKFSCIVQNYGLCHFRLTLPQFNSKLIVVFLIHNDTPYFRNVKTKWLNVTDPQKIQP